jgi:hypothetical protein
VAAAESGKVSKMVNFRKSDALPGGSPPSAETRRRLAQNRITDRVDLVGGVQLDQVFQPTVFQPASRRPESPLLCRSQSARSCHTPIDLPRATEVVE